MLHNIELAKHDIHIEEDNREAEDEVADVPPDGAGGNVAETVRHIHLNLQALRWDLSWAKKNLVKVLK